MQVQSANKPGCLPEQLCSFQEGKEIDDEANKEQISKIDQEIKQIQNDLKTDESKIDTDDASYGAQKDEKQKPAPTNENTASLIEFNPGENKAFHKDNQMS